MSTSIHKLVPKYLPTQQLRNKFKRQCLKAKNIIEENQTMQIGCKVEKLYDFYESKNFVQVSLFLGNKLTKPIQKYSIEWRGSQNLSIWVQQKEEKWIREKTQSKQRIVIEWLPEMQDHNSNHPGLIFLTMTFTSPLMTLKDTPIPISLYSFYNFPSTPQQLFPQPLTYSTIYNQIKQTYELIEEQEISLNLALFKKGFAVKELEKFLDKLMRIKKYNAKKESEDQGIFVGMFTVKTLLEEVAVIVETVNASSIQPKLKITLAANEYTYFQPIFDNLNFIFGK